MARQALGTTVEIETEKSAAPCTRTPIQVLLLGDYPIVRSGLRLLLERQPEINIVGEDTNRADAVDCAATPPDIILIDLDSAGGPCLDFLPELLARAQTARAIVLTSSHNCEIHQRLLRLGAMGVVLKELPVEKLMKVIETVNAGEIWIDRSVMADMLKAISSANVAKEKDDESRKIATLTKREREIVSLFGAGLNNKRVAKHLFISETTVRHHLTAIFDKLEVRDRFELVFYAYRHGLARPPC